MGGNRISCQWVVLVVNKYGIYIPAKRDIRPVTSCEEGQGKAETLPRIHEKHWPSPTDITGLISGPLGRDVSYLYYV